MAFYLAGWDNVQADQGDDMTFTWGKMLFHRHYQ